MICRAWKVTYHQQHRQNILLTVGTLMNTIDPAIVPTSIRQQSQASAGWSPFHAVQDAGNFTTIKCTSRRHC